MGRHLLSQLVCVASVFFSAEAFSQCPINHEKLGEFANKREIEIIKDMKYVDVELKYHDKVSVVTELMVAKSTLSSEYVELQYLRAWLESCKDGKND